MTRKYPMIDTYKTGQKIKEWMTLCGLTVRDIQDFLGLGTPQSIYHWIEGRNMPTVDNLYGLSELFHVPVDAMLCGMQKEPPGFYGQSFYRRLGNYYKRWMEVQAG